MPLTTYDTEKPPTAQSEASLLLYNNRCLLAAAALDGYLFDAALMAPALERRAQELVDNLQRKLGRDEAGREHQHIGIVVLTGQTGQLDIPAQRRAYALMLVERHADAIARAAQSDAGIYATGLDSLGTRMGEVGIVAALGAVGAEIDILHTLRLEIALDDTLHFISGMVAAQADGHTFFKNIHIVDK